MTKPRTGNKLQMYSIRTKDGLVAEFRYQENGDITIDIEGRQTLTFSRNSIEELPRMLLVMIAQHEYTPAPHSSVAEQTKEQAPASPTDWATTITNYAGAIT